MPKYESPDLAVELDDLASRHYNPVSKRMSEEDHETIRDAAQQLRGYRDVDDDTADALRDIAERLHEPSTRRIGADDYRTLHSAADELE